MPAKRRNIALGILLIARGRADGLAQFGDTPQAVLAALTPLAAFLVVGGALALLSGNGIAGLADLLAIVVGLLGPLVLSWEVARRWGRGAEWFRFAAAYCWCQWAGPVAMVVLLAAMALMMAVGVAGETAAMVGLLGLFGYGLWLHWFLARHALSLSARRALALVLMVNAATSILVILPELAAG